MALYNNRYNIQNEIKYAQGRQYKYFVDEENRNKNDVLELNEPLDGSKFFIRDESDNSFWCFDSSSDYFARPMHHAHEVILGSLPQKLKFDIDAPADLLEDLPEMFLPVPVPPIPDNSLYGQIEAILYEEELRTYASMLPHYDSRDKRQRRWLFSEIMKAIMYTFDILYGITLKQAQFLVTDQSDETKFSRHVIIPGYAVSNANEARYFTNLVCDILKNAPCQIDKFLDRGVNKELQNFRMINCTKSGSNRVKKFLYNTFTVYDTLISHTVSLTVLPSVVPVEKKIMIECNDIDDSNVLKIAAKYTDGFVFGKRVNSLYIFKRIMPSHCAICDIIHHRDNTLMISVTSMRQVILMCRHAPGMKLNIGEIPGVIIDNMMAYNDLEPIEGASIIEYVETAVRKFEFSGNKYDTLLINSPMGTCKTLTLQELIITLPLTIRIVLVSCRRTLSDAFMGKFPDFIDYRKVQGEISQMRVIVQYESLHRLKVLPEVECLFVLDECESVIGQFEHKPAGIEKDNKTWTVFLWHMQYATKIIAMDAMVGYRSNILLSLTRKRILVHNNLIRKQFKDYYYKQHNDFLHDLMAAAKDCISRPFVCISNSITQLKNYLIEFQRICPGARIKIYTGESSDAEKSADLVDVNVAWEHIDILMYTSTISQGISYEGGRFGTVFAMFTNMSTDYKTSIQMLGRIRKVTEYRIFIKSHGANLPDDWDSINNMLLDEASIVKLDRMGFKSHVGNREKILDKEGKLNFAHKDIRLCMHMANLRYFIQSRNMYFKRFINERIHAGAIINFPNIAKYTEGFDIILGRQKDNIKSIKEADRRAIASAKNIADEDVYDMRKSDKLNELDRLALKKKNLADHYGVAVESITEEFIKHHGSRKRKMIFHNLNMVSVAENIEESIKIWSKVTYDGVRKNRNIAACNFALGLLGIIDSTYAEQMKSFNKQFINKLTLEEHLPAIMFKINESKNTVSLLYEIRLDRLENLIERKFKEQLKCLNSILGYTFGITIKRDKVKRKMFYISPPSMLQCDDASGRYFPL